MSEEEYEKYRKQAPIVIAVAMVAGFLVAGGKMWAVPVVLVLAGVYITIRLGVASWFRNVFSR